MYACCCNNSQRILNGEKHTQSAAASPSVISGRGASHFVVSIMSDTDALCPVTFDAAAVEVPMSFYVIPV